jgi:outer membrane lipoprotein SlyB
MFAALGLALAGGGVAAGMMWRPSAAADPVTVASVGTAPDVAPAVPPMSQVPQTSAPVETTKPMTSVPTTAPTASTHKPKHTSAVPSERVAVADGATRTVADVPREVPARPIAVCETCGVIDSVHAVTRKGQGTGLGAVAGGVLGGVLGHQVGGGNGRTVMSVLGAVGGGLAGNEVEKRARAETVYEVTVRMDDGSTRTFTRREAPAVGAKVTVEGNDYRLGHTSTAPVAPSTTASPSSGMTFTSAGLDR